MRQRAVAGFDKGLLSLQASAESGRLRDRAAAGEGLGRLRERFSRASKLFGVQISEQPDPDDPSKRRVCIAWSRHNERLARGQLSEGCYLLRTNLRADNPEQLWNTYIGLTQVEDTFRIAKHDLELRPIFHHKTKRVQAHILVCFLALVLWRTLQQWMAARGLGTAPRKLLEAMAQVRSMDIVLPTASGQKLRLRVVSKPEPLLAELLDHLDLPLPNKPKRIQNVVENLPLPEA